jgi:hypothetical protein
MNARGLKGVIESMKPVHCVLIALVMAALLAACGADIAPPPTSAFATPSAGTTTVASAIPQASAGTDDPAFGAWRRSPIRPAADFTREVQAACSAETAVGSRPLAVFDARGEGYAILVFADATGAALCRATVGSDGHATVEARAVKGATGTTKPASGLLGIHDLEILSPNDNPRSVLVGMVGDQVNDVAVNFDADAAWSKAAMANGWYAIWWPSAERPQAVASSDIRSVVIDSYRP